MKNNELTISEILEKKEKLKTDMENLLHAFHEETGLDLKGEINFGYTKEKYQHYVIFTHCLNPFQ